MTEAALTAWQRDPGTLWRRVADSLVLLTPGRTQPVGVFGSAGVLWDLLVGPASVAELSERLADSYGGKRETLQASLLEALRELQAVGAVVTVELDGSLS